MRSHRFSQLILNLILVLSLALTGLLSRAEVARAAGTVSLTTLGSAYTQDFNTLAITGTVNTNLPTGWDLSESGSSSRNNGAYAASTGSDIAGDVYSFGATGNTERAYGTLRSGTLVPLFGASFTNDTGSSITSLAISYTGEQWRAGVTNRGAADRLDFQLSTDATSLATGTWLDYNDLDFNSPNIIASTNTLDGNAADNRANVNFTISGLNIPNGDTFWIRWTDFDISSSDDGLSIDDFSISAFGTTDSILSINDVTANEGDSGTTSFEFTVSLSGPAPTGGVSFDIATADDTATVANNDYVANALTGETIQSGISSYAFNVLVNGDTDAESDETFFVNVTNVIGATVGDGQGVGTIVNDDVALTPIHSIQGSGDAVTGTGPFTVEAIVVGDYQTQGSGQLRGFFIQEEDTDADADPLTSEGIFVFCSSCPTPVSVGDKVRVTGTASDFFGMSQLTASTAASVTVISSDNSLPTPGSVQLPVPDVPDGDLALATAAINAYFEAYEGMLVTFPATLSVSEYFELARYGQVILTEGGRPRQYTDANAPSVEGLINHEIDLATRTIILDDTDNRQNRPVDPPNTAYYHPVPGLSTGNFFRGGDTITGLTGVLHWSFAGQSGTDAWRIRPVTEAFSYAFSPANLRPEVPDVGGTLKVASFNVLNYFVTIDTTSSNTVGTCGPLGDQDCRGADSVQELERQRAKLTQALIGLNADIIGIIEMENTTGVEPLAQIVSDLNLVAGAGTYAYIDTGVIGTDAIRVGMVYKPASVTPLGPYAILDTSVDPRFLDEYNRPVLAQSFQDNSTGGIFTVAVNHLKSKGSDCNAEGDFDVGDGQGNCNGTRTLAAQALADWLASDPTGSGDVDVLIIGDLNSYAKEDPIVALQNAGYTDLVAAFGGPSAYSFVFDGQLGYLDHALANSTMLSQVTGVAEWHINADEVPLFDYNDDVRDTGEASFEEESDVLPLYEANAFRTSDHDPVIVGLDLLHYDWDGFFPPVANPPDLNEANAGSSISVRFSLDGDQGLDVFAAGYPLSIPIDCSTSAEIGPAEETVTAGKSGLTYDPLTDEYVYPWKTEKGWANSCRRLVLVLDDGTIKTADFQFTK
jgi:predicted extracellular nuclease